MKIRSSILLVFFITSPAYSSNNVDLLNRINEQDKTIKNLREVIGKLQKQIRELKEENRKLKLARLQTVKPNINKAESRPLYKVDDAIISNIMKHPRFRFFYPLYKFSIVIADNKYFFCPNMVKKNKNQKQMPDRLDELSTKSAKGDMGFLKGEVVKVINKNELLISRIKYVSLTSPLYPRGSRFLTAKPPSRRVCIESAIFHITGIETKGLISGKQWESNLLVVGTYKYTDTTGKTRNILSLKPVTVPPFGLKEKEFAISIYILRETMPEEIREFIKKALIQ